MGYVAAYSGTITLNLPTADYWVKLKRCLSRRELAAAEDLLSQAVLDMQGNGSVKPDVSGYRTAMVAASIAEWNLDDDNGTALPITAATVGLLAGPDFDAVWNKVDELNKAMEPQEQARFPVTG